MKKIIVLLIMLFVLFWVMTFMPGCTKSREDKIADELNKAKKNYLKMKKKFSKMKIDTEKFAKEKTEEAKKLKEDLEEDMEVKLKKLKEQYHKKVAEIKKKIDKEKK